MFKVLLILLFLTVSLPGLVIADEEGIDASDPTKIYTYVGAGVKYTDYTNSESMTELRATGNIGLSESDMLLFEFGYGWHSGDKVPGDNSDLTNARVRWFHLFPMDYSVVRGYQGWGTQIDLQLAGNLKGTDGQNLLTLGVLPAFSLNQSWNFYLPLNLVNSWDKNFKKYNGVGIGAAPLLVYSADHWWPGGYVQIWPNYTYFVGGELENEGSGNIDLITGGEITPKLFWSITAQKNVDKDLNAFRRDRASGLKNDWNGFLNLTSYF